MEGSASERERERHERDAAHEVIDSDEGLCIFAGNEELKELPAAGHVTSHTQRQQRRRKD